MGAALAARGSRHAPVPLLPLDTPGHFEGCLQLGAVPAEGLAGGGSQGGHRGARGAPGTTHHGKVPRARTLTFSASMFLSAMTASGPWKRRGREGDGHCVTVLEGAGRVAVGKAAAGIAAATGTVTAYQVSSWSRQSWQPVVPWHPLKPRRELGYFNPVLKAVQDRSLLANCTPISHHSPGGLGHRGVQGVRGLRGDPATPQHTIRER